ncbi:trypsin-like peptidase domain-containing protein [Streptomyces sp. NBC_00237]|uniref:S1C family serine protease n=1 Tax=Streptomyces sp. NBC_00237 TaxID=2975687 RepID=UPI0022523297|nr:trypsin-like peptidase domain-containing protein [Streptomyces sp. NBC_00237]MCX5200337.1 trypsin-like peptidase domain-containing protein [Streptomyces sp. NBC_00237]
MSMTTETPRPSGEQPEPSQSQTPYAQYAGFPPPPAHAPTAQRRRAGRPVALLAAVAVVAATFGGGAAYLTQKYAGDDTTGVNSAGAPGSNVSQSSMGTVSGVAQAVGPAIVEISAQSSAGASTGSGVIITADGEVVTNNHVVAGADTVKVTLSTGRSYTAKVVGTDPDKDLALLKVQGAPKLPTAKLGSSKDVKVGDEVVAIGSPEGLSGTVTSGIVSALDRDVTVSKDEPRQQQRGGGGGWPFEFGGEQFNGDTGQSKTTYKAIQTDASLNPGNSGGALINMRGEIIGINSAMYAPSSGGQSASGSVGLGFAIPVDTVKADLDGLRKGGSGGQQDAPQQQEQRGGGLIGGLGV